jgi:hypothetical protein
MKLQANGWTNVAGTSTRSPNCPNCGHWKTHWENIAAGKPWPEECAVDGCNQTAVLGGHMHQTNGPEYIVPLCKGCNTPNNTAPVSLKKGTVIVAANVGKSCNRYNLLDDWINGKSDVIGEIV